MNITKQCLNCNKFFNKPEYHSKKVWELRRFCSHKCASLSWVGHKPPKSAYKKGQNKEKSNFQWKGERATYSSKHSWVARHKTKPKNCENCGVEGDSRQITWSNIDHEYKRNLNDYKALCWYCHNKHHRDNHLVARLN